MKHKRMIAWILCLVMAFSLAPAALAETEEDPDADAEALELIEPAVKNGEDEDALLQAEDGAIAPEGFALPECGGGCKSDAVGKTVEKGKAQSFDLGDGFTAVLKDGVMTVSGTGELSGSGKAEDSPWYDSRAEITAVVFESGITQIGGRLFWNCENLTSVQIPNGVTYVGSVFCGCTALKSVTLPASVTDVSCTFAGCSALESVTAPGLGEIGDYTFQGTAIRTFTVPKTLKRISPLAFWDGALDSYAEESGNPVYSVKNGILLTDDGRTLASYPAGRTDASVRIPDGVETIGESAFASNRYVKTVDFNGVTKLAFSAFTSCRAIETLVIPDTITEMGACAFENCEGLRSVRFGKGLKKTGYRTFAGCTALESIDFGTALETIGGLCFAWCDGLKEIRLPENVKTAENGCFGECRNLETFVSTALTVFPYQILLNDVSLRSLTINDGVTEINRYAVYGTPALKEVDVPASVQIINDYGFDPRYTKVNVGNAELDPYGRSGWRKQEYITVNGLYNYDKAFEVLELVNRERTAAGLKPLAMDTDLTGCAMQRAMELAVLFSHTRPDGSAFYSPYMGSLWAENAAEYQATAEEVMDAWMNSDGHRENILTSYYEKIGVGCVEVEGRCYWIQWFAKYSANELAKPANVTVTRRIGYAVDPFGDAPQTSDVIFYFTQPPEYSYVFQTEKSHYGMRVGDTQEIRVFLRGCCVSEKGRFLNAPIPYDADELRFSVADPSVATIENGVLTAKANGKTTVTIRTMNKRFTFRVGVSVGTLASADVTFAAGEVRYSGSTPYVVADGKAKTPRVVVTDGDGSVVDPSRYTVAYRNNVNAGTAEAIVTMKDSGESRVVWFKIYLPPTTATSVENLPVPLIRWDPVPGAKGYVIYRRAWNLRSGGWTAFERWNNTTKTYFYDRKVYAGTRYQYGVKAYFSEPMDNYNLGLVGPLKTIVYVTQREITDLKAGSGSLTVTWDESGLFTGYQVQVIRDCDSANPVKETYRITDPKTHTLTVKGLRSGVTYTVRVRSFTVFEGMTYFGEWSYAKTCEVR